MQIIAAYNYANFETNPSVNKKIVKIGKLQFTEHIFQTQIFNTVSYTG